MKWLIVVSFAAVALASPQGYNYQQAGGHGGGGGFAGAASGGGGFSSGGGLGGGFGGGGGGGGGFGGGFGGGSGGGYSSGGGGGYASGPATVTRHVYVHVAPAEPEEPIAAPQLPAAQNNKHYKILFIKAPEYKFSAPTIHAQAGKNEEKTIVYVLSKKPEVPAPQIIGGQSHFKPEKPEVYFIKYKGQKAPSSSYGAPAAASAPSAEYGAPSSGGGGGASSAGGY